MIGVTAIKSACYNNNLLDIISDIPAHLKREPANLINDKLALLVWAV